MTSLVWGGYTAGALVGGHAATGMMEVDEVVVVVVVGAEKGSENGY